MRNHSITIRGHATSVSMEDEFWTSLKMMAKSRNMSIAALVTQIDAQRLDSQNLSSALRLAVLEWWQTRHAELCDELKTRSPSKQVSEG
ncbi:MAG: ribbon-helix-helix domain-containing protein [Pseudomonadota bacterium]